MVGTKSLLDLVYLKLDLEDSLGQPIDVVTYNLLNPKIKDKVIIKIYWKQKYIYLTVIYLQILQLYDNI